MCAGRQLRPCIDAPLPINGAKAYKAGEAEQKWLRDLLELVEREGDLLKSRR
jgi:hypothetical protein